MALDYKLYSDLDYKLYSDYRKEQNKFAAEWFKVKKYTVHKKYDYILDTYENWKNNIIVGDVADFIEKLKNEAKSKKEPFPLHKYIHNGCSSQAMLFNLLGDIVRNNDYHFLSQLFKYEDVSINNESKLLFEFSDRETFNEKQQQPTSFDFVVKNTKGKDIFVEAKYVETEFGGCSVIKGDNPECDGQNPVKDTNLCYLTHKGRNYWELMKKYELDKVFEQSVICPFSIYYQFYRELMFAMEKNGYFVMLIDKRNPAFQKFNEEVLTSLLPEKYKDIVKVIYMQDVVNKLDISKYNWIDDFKLKYFGKVEI
ncbi:hypothetical protein AGMMS49938_01190 [Fibrobacterales bacterium]|nr:hypothetical protein AGMMS49938_01190 [Fibrobacterales bacterium]